MKEFNSLIKFAEHLVKVQTTEIFAIHKAVDNACALIEKTAKSEFGHYQPQVGPFQGWAELAESTKEDRARHGYSDNEPLLRSGELRDSISRKVSLLEGEIGSTSEIMVYHEFGTTKIPPRPVLGPAAFSNKEKIKKIIGTAAVKGLMGELQIHKSLGYDFET